jgi:hypothetical protein
MTVASQFGVYSQPSPRHHLRLMTITLSAQAAEKYAADLYTQSPGFGKLWVVEGPTRIYFRPGQLADFRVVAAIGEFVR